MRSRTCSLALAIVLLVALTSRADWHTATVGAGNGIASIAVDPVRNRTYVANSSGTVSVVDGTTNAVQTWTAGQNPSYMAVNPFTGKLYVTNDNPTDIDTVLVFDASGTITGRLAVNDYPCDLVLDLDSNRLFVSHGTTKAISVYQNDVFLADIPTGSEPYKMALNPVSRMIYVMHTEWDSVTCVDMDALTATSIYVGDGTSDLAVNASVNKLYVANNYTDSVKVLDCATNTVTASVGAGDDPFSVICDPSGRRAYVSNYSDRSVTVIDCLADTVMAKVPMDAVPGTMAFNSATGKLYVNNISNNPCLRIIDSKNGYACDSVNLGHSFWYMAVNPVTNRIYVGLECGNPDSLAVIEGADYDTTLFTTGPGTYHVAINPITGDAFYTHNEGNSVTVVKANGTTQSITVGNNPSGLAVNPLTNKAFICNSFSKSVSVIDGASYSVERTIPVDTIPTVIAVNPLTNFIYVNSYLASANRIKVIDGKDWDTTSIPVGLKPFSISINQATNRIYVGNDVSNNVTIIDGAHNTALATTSYINHPYGIDINSATNKIYVASLQNSGVVTVIDGATNGLTPVPVGNWPTSVTVNKANNKIYVANANDSTVTEIDGATNATETIKVGVLPENIAADPVTGKVFVSNSNSHTLSIIDCASRRVKTMAVPAGPRKVAVNPANGNIYLACYSASQALVLDQAVDQDTKVNSYDYTPSPWGRKFPAATQDRDMITINHWSPNRTRVHGGLFSLASSESFWKFGSNYAVTDSSLRWQTENGWGADTAMYGENIYRCFGLESQVGVSNNLGTGTPFVGNILSTTMYRVDNAGPTIAWWDSLADDNDSTGGYGPYPVRAVITDFSGIDSAGVCYLDSTTKAWPMVIMTRAQADTFVGVIPAMSVAVGESAYYQYSIKAWDHANGANANNSGNSNNPTVRRFNLRNLTGVAGNPVETGLPRTFALQSAYPNPSQGQTVIKYQLPKGVSNVQLQVYNVAGQMVKTINEGAKPAGHHQIIWNDGKLSNGIYFYKLKAGQFSATRKMVVLK